MQGLFEAELASESFVTAMRMWPTLAEGWVSWGTFLLQQYAQLGRGPAQAQKLEGGLISYFQVAFSSYCMPGMFLLTLLIHVVKTAPSKRVNFYFHRVTLGVPAVLLVF
jgi:hypothetical protein